MALTLVLGGAALSTLAGSAAVWSRGSDRARGAPVALIVAGATAMVIRSPVRVAVVAAFGVVTSLVHLVVRERRSRRIPPAELADALERMAAALRTGASPRQALAEVAAEASGATAADLRLLHRRVELGLPVADTIRSWARMRPGSTEIAHVSTALAMALDSGGSAARAVDEVADAVRARQDLEAEVASLAAQARLSAVLIGVLPAAFMAVVGAVDPEVVTGLVGTGFGRACLIAGSTLGLAGWVWMRRIIASVEP